MLVCLDLMGFVITVKSPEQDPQWSLVGLGLKTGYMVFPFAPGTLAFSQKSVLLRSPVFTLVLNLILFELVQCAICIYCLWRAEKIKL